MSNIGGAVILGGAIVYGALKHKYYKKKMALTEKRVSLISDTQLSQQVNNKNSGKDLDVNNPKQKYPSSSRLRYNRRRYL